MTGQLLSDIYFVSVPWQRSRFLFRGQRMKLANGMGKRTNMNEPWDKVLLSFHTFEAVDRQPR